MNLVLIGYRGTGKSTVARRLGERLEWEWVDCDTRIEARAGRSIREIFDQGGEATFREIEAGVIAELAPRDRLVIATGGGAVLDRANRAALRRRGWVVWLTARPETIHHRLAGDAATPGRRPALTAAGGGLAEIVQVLRHRAPIYRRCADLVVETDGRSAAAVAETIMTWMTGRD